MAAVPICKKTSLAGKIVQCERALGNQNSPTQLEHEQIVCNRLSALEMFKQKIKF